MRSVADALKREDRATLAALTASVALRPGADRLSLYSRVIAHRRGRRIRFAVVGAAALVVHGVSRATRDLDLLVTDAACLAEGTRVPLRQAGITITITIRPGDADDPLAGVVRLSPGREAPPCRPCRKIHASSGLV